MVIVAHVLASTERTNDPATDSPRWSKFIFTAQKRHDEALPLTSEHSCTYGLGYSHSTPGKQWAFISEHTYSVRSECDNHFTTPQDTQSLRALYCLRYATARTHSPHSPAIIRSSCGDVRRQSVDYNQKVGRELLARWRRTALSCWGGEDDGDSDK